MLKSIIQPLSKIKYPQKNQSNPTACLNFRFSIFKTTTRHRIRSLIILSVTSGCHLYSSLLVTSPPSSINFAIIAAAAAQSVEMGPARSSAAGAAAAACSQQLVPSSSSSNTSAATGVRDRIPQNQVQSEIILFPSSMVASYWSAGARQELARKIIHACGRTRAPRGNRSGEADGKPLRCAISSQRGARDKALAILDRWIERLLDLYILPKYLNLDQTVQIAHLLELLLQSSTNIITKLSDKEITY